MRLEYTAEELREALSNLRQAHPRWGEFDRLVREGARGDEEFSSRMTGDDLAGFCHAVSVLYAYHGYDRSRHYWDQPEPGEELDYRLCQHQSTRIEHPSCFQQATGEPAVPYVEPKDYETLEEVLRDIVANADSWGDFAYKVFQRDPEMFRRLRNAT